MFLLRLINPKIGFLCLFAFYEFWSQWTVMLVITEIKLYVLSSKSKRNQSIQADTKIFLPPKVYFTILTLLLEYFISHHGKLFVSVWVCPYYQARWQYIYKALLVILLKEKWNHTVYRKDTFLNTTPKTSTTSHHHSLLATLQPSYTT